METLTKLREYLLEIGVTYRLYKEGEGRLSVYDQEDLNIFKIKLGLKSERRHRYTFRVGVPVSWNRSPNIYEVFERLNLDEPPTLTAYLKREGYAPNARYGQWKHKNLVENYRRTLVIFSRGQVAHIKQLLDEYKNETLDTKE